MKINELQTKNTSLREVMVELNDLALTEKRDFTDEEQTKYDDTKSEIELNERSITRMEANEKLNIEMAGATLRNEDDGENADVVTSQRNAWADYVKTGVISRDFQGPNGGFQFRADPLLTSTQAGIINKGIAPMSVLNTQGLAFAQSLGVNIMTGLTGILELPNMAQIDASMVAEGAAVGLANAAPAVIELKPVTFGTTQSFSKQFLLNSSSDIVGKIVADMGAANERKILDHAFSTFLTDALDASISTTAGGLTYGDMVNLKAIDYNLGNTAYVTTTAVRAYLEQNNAGSAGIKFIYDNNTVAGEPAFATKAADTNAVYFGDWSSMVIGVWGSPEVILDEYKYKQYGKTEIAVMSYADAGIQNHRSFKWANDCSAGV